MDLKTRYAGLDELLSIIYGEGIGLSALLGEIGFERVRVEQLQNGHGEIVVAQFLEFIHTRLTSDSGKDTYYQILSRRYGLDGEPRQQLSAIAEKYGYSPEYVHQLFEEILHRCQSKTWQTELRKSLKYIAVNQFAQRRRVHPPGL
jgi:AraC-like DNA-binding protein